MIDSKSLKNFGLAMLVLATLIAFLFGKSFSPDMTLFANDGPLGVVMSEHGEFRKGWDGVWNDLNWLGMSYLTVLPHTSTLSWYLLGDSPVIYSKFLVPLSLCALGASLWICLRRFGLSYPVCALAAIAAALNMNSFSHAAWGLASRCWAMACAFLAIAALRSSVNGRPILKALLAGMAVGNGIMEAYDVGAIYSLYVAGIGFFVMLAYAQVNALSIAWAAARVGIVAVFAAICAAAALNILISTQVQGISGMQQDVATKQARWDGATMWSLPKAETLRVLVPGLFGYRMDAEDGGNYWGSSGQTPGNPQTRHSGSGEYAGALVMVVAAFAVAGAFRKKNNPFSPNDRKVVLCLAVAAFISLLFAWGRHAPFYQIIYALPFFSTIRNPMKFMHPLHMALLILFGFGLEIIFRACAKDVATRASGLKTALSNWWAKASPFEKNWTRSSLGFCGLFLLGTFVYLSSRKELLAYLRTAGFAPESAEKVASFSYSEAMWACFYITLATLLVITALSGWFSGRRARYLVIAFGLFLMIDLGLANRPWINYYNYKELYESNQVLDFLRKDGHEHRVTARLTPFGAKHLVVDDPGQANTSFFASVANQWLQHHFQWYNIQAIEPNQMPRPPEIDENYFKALFPDRGAHVIPRLWELTNTRYLIGDKNFIALLLQQVEPGQQRFRFAMTFDMAPKPGRQLQGATLTDLTWVENPNGRFAVVEFTGALPRASLYPAWQKVTDDPQSLKDLTSPAFNPRTNLLVHGDVPFSPSAGTNFTGSALITSYKSKRIELAVSNNAPAILLYNDKLDAGWTVMVDGKPEDFLRVNYIMRGVPLPAGAHTVVMKYSITSKALYVSFAGIAVALAALGIVAFGPVKRSET